MEQLKARVKTSEFQIEKDWQIIESQGQQLENLHQQFIEQRDENLQNQRLVKSLKKNLKEKSQQGMITDEDSLENCSEDEQQGVDLTNNNNAKSPGLITTAGSQSETSVGFNTLRFSDVGIVTSSHQVVETAEKECQVTPRTESPAIDPDETSLIHLGFTPSEASVENRNLLQVMNEMRNVGERRQGIDLDYFEDFVEAKQKLLLLEESLKKLEFARKESEDRLTIKDEAYEKLRHQLVSLETNLQSQATEKDETIKKLSKEMSESQQRAKRREEELVNLLNEKEDGIEKLHAMIRELEKSLSNSQVHIEGMFMCCSEQFYPMFRFLDFNYYLGFKIG